MKTARIYSSALNWGASQRTLLALLIMGFSGAQAEANICSQGPAQDPCIYVFSIDYGISGQTKALESLVNRLVRQGFPVFRAHEDFMSPTEDGGVRRFGSGSFVLSSKQREFSELIIRVSGTPKPSWLRCSGPIKIKATRIHVPVIAIYNDTGNSLAPLTGFGRCFEHLGFPYLLITKDEILKGILDRVDLLVMTGGDEPWYGIGLRGEGNRRIRDFVWRGGSYLGACAGAYYASRNPVLNSDEMPGYGLKEYPGPNPVEFLNILDFTCLNNITWKEMKRMIPDPEKFIRHGSRDVGFDACWYSDYREVAQAYPFRVGSRPFLINKQKDHPVMYGLPDKFWQKYAGGPMMAPTGNSLSLADFLIDIPKGNETFDPEKAKSLLLENASAILHGNFGKGRGVVFSCHPEKNEETYLAVANAVYYLTNPAPTEVTLPSDDRETKLYRAREIFLDRGAINSSLDSLCQTLQGNRQVNHELLAATPAPLREAAEGLARQAEESISEILSDSRKIKRFLENLPSDFEFPLVSTCARQIMNLPTDLRKMKALLQEADREFEGSRTAVQKLTALPTLEEKCLSFARDYFFFFMGKEDLLGSGDFGINRWAPGVGDDHCRGILPLFHEIQQRLFLSRETLEFAYGHELKIGGENEGNRRQD